MVPQSLTLFLEWPEFGDITNSRICFPDNQFQFFFSIRVLLVINFCYVSVLCKILPYTSCGNVWLYFSDSPHFPIHPLTLISYLSLWGGELHQLFLSLPTFVCVCRGNYALSGKQLVARQEFQRYQILVTHYSNS